MPSWMMDETIWNKAKEAAKKSGQAGNYAVITSIYKKMGGRINKHVQKALIQKDKLNNRISLEQAKALGDKLGIKWGAITVEAFREGLVEELEHDDITHKDPVMTGKIAAAHLNERPDYYDRLEEVMKKALPQEREVHWFVRGEHLSPEQEARIKHRYSSDPGKWSVRSLAEAEGVSRHQVERIVHGLGASVKTEKQIHAKQHDHAKFLGKKLPEHIVHAEHEGRDKEIATRPATSMERPIARWLHQHGIHFQSQVRVDRLIGEDDPEAGIVDFYVPSKKLIIQGDGPRHSLANVKHRVGIQDQKLHAHGYTVLHIPPKDMDHLDKVLSQHL